MGTKSAFRSATNFNPSLPLLRQPALEECRRGCQDSRRPSHARSAIKSPEADTEISPARTNSPRREQEFRKFLIQRILAKIIEAAPVPCGNGNQIGSSALTTKDLNLVFTSNSRRRRPCPPHAPRMDIRPTETTQKYSSYIGNNLKAKIAPQVTLLSINDLLAISWQAASLRSIAESVQSSESHLAPSPPVAQ